MIYSKNRLTRKDLLSKNKDLWNLIEDHQARCSYKKIKGFVRELNPDMIDFLFGRPLTETIKMYDMQVKHKGNRYYLKPLNMSSKL